MTYFDEYRDAFAARERAENPPVTYEIPTTPPEQPSETGADYLVCEECGRDDPPLNGNVAIAARRA